MTNLKASIILFVLPVFVLVIFAVKFDSKGAENTKYELSTVQNYPQETQTQSPIPVDILDDHSMLAESFIELLSNRLDVENTLFEKKRMSTGKLADFTTLSIGPTSSSDFKSIVDFEVMLDRDIENIAGGWTDENGVIMTLLNLNTDDKKARALMLIAYDAFEGKAVFNTMSSVLN
ncbi:MAG: hypothetical protein RID02_08255 [Gracilimonas sp.]